MSAASDKRGFVQDFGQTLIIVSSVVGAVLWLQSSLGNIKLESHDSIAALTLQVTKLGSKVTSLEKEVARGQDLKNFALRLQAANPEIVVPEVRPQ